MMMDARGFLTALAAIFLFGFALYGFGKLMGVL